MWSGYWGARTILFRDKLCVGWYDQCYKVSVMKDPPGRGEDYYGAWTLQTALDTQYNTGEERQTDICLPHSLLSYFLLLLYVDCLVWIILSAYPQLPRVLIIPHRALMTNYRHWPARQPGRALTPDSRSTVRLNDTTDKWALMVRWNFATFIKSSNLPYWIYWNKSK